MTLIWQMLYNDVGHIQKRSKVWGHPSTRSCHPSTPVGHPSTQVIHPLHPKLEMMYDLIELMYDLMQLYDPMGVDVWIEHSCQFVPIPTGSFYCRYRFGNAPAHFLIGRFVYFCCSIIFFTFCNLIYLSSAIFRRRKGRCLSCELSLGVHSLVLLLRSYRENSLLLDCGPSICKSF